MTLTIFGTNQILPSHQPKRSACQVRPKAVWPKGPDLIQGFPQNLKGKQGQLCMCGAPRRRRNNTFCSSRHDIFNPISKGVIAGIRYAKDSFGCFKHIEGEYFQFCASSEIDRYDKAGRHHQGSHVLKSLAGHHPYIPSLGSPFYF